MSHVSHALAALALWTAASVADAAPSAPTALSAIQPGQWALRSSDGDAPSRSLCLGDTRQLLQLRHRGAVCSRYLIADEPTQTVVHYTCPGAGHGRTTVRVETGRLIQIESQGIADNSPFAIAFEGRRVGACAAGAR